MSEEKMNESKGTSPDELTKTTKPSDVQLTEEDLATASGGLSIMKVVDKTTPVLFDDCCSGQHVTKA